jgi:hypothetical protein
VTIKRDQLCPNCEGRLFLHVARVQELGGLNRATEMTITHRRGAPGDGAFEQFICTGCGYTEWYAGDLQSVRPDPEQGIHLIDARTPDHEGPFR